MDNIIKDGENMMDGGNNSNQSQGMGNSQGMDNSQQQSSGNSGGSGGGFMSGMKQNTEDAYINNEANSLMTKEGLPSAADGVVDGAIDTEVNKFQKDL